MATRCHQQEGSQRSHVWGIRDQRRGLYTVRPNTYWVMVTLDPCGQIDTYENITITFPQKRTFICSAVAPCALNLKYIYTWN